LITLYLNSISQLNSPSNIKDIILNIILFCLAQLFDLYLASVPYSIVKTEITRCQAPYNQVYKLIYLSTYLLFFYPCTYKKCKCQSIHKCLGSILALFQAFYSFISSSDPLPLAPHIHKCFTGCDCFLVYMFIDIFVYRHALPKMAR
jgi:hypothetical protein